jgi:hypothetical protein
MKEKAATTDTCAEIRHNMSVDVLVAVKGQPLMTLKTGNMTEKDVFLLSNNCQLPAVGTEVMLTMEEFLQRSDPLAMRARIEHKNERGIVVKLLGPVT